MGFTIALIVIGIVVILLGVLTLKFPDWEWKLSISRMLYLRNGEPTQLYYTMQKLGAVFSIIMGIIFIICGIGRGLSEAGITGESDEKIGFVVYIDNQEIRLPCDYEDIAAIGFTPCKGEEMGYLDSNDREHIEVENSKGKIMKIYIINRTGQRLPAEECEVYGLKAEYKTQTYEFIFDDADDLVTGNYQSSVGYTDVNDGPSIELENGFSNNLSGDEAEKILGKGNIGITGKYKNYYGVFSGSQSADLTVGYGGLKGDDEITFITIECFK